MADDEQEPPNDASPSSHPPSAQENTPAGQTDFRTMSALPDITEIAAFPSGNVYSSPLRTSCEPRTTLPQLLEAHFLRLRNTLLLALRLEFEIAGLFESPVGPLSIGPVQSELGSEHLHLSSYGRHEDACGQEHSTKDTDIEAGDDGTPDAEPAEGDRVDNAENDKDNWEDTSDDDKESETEEEQEDKMGKPTSRNDGSDSDSAGDRNFLAFNQLYQNHLCFVVSNGRVLAMGKYPRGIVALDHWQVYVPATSPSNMNYRVQRLTNQIPLDSIKYLRLGAPTWRVLPVLEALQTRNQLPLSEELISYSLDPPRPVVPPKLALLLGSLIQDNRKFAYDMLGLRSKFRKTRILDRSDIRACIPAFTQRVTLYKQKAGK